MASPGAYKICPQCTQPSPLDAPACLHCGHQFRTQFVTPGQTQAFQQQQFPHPGYPPPPQHYFQPLPWWKTTWAKYTSIGLACCAFFVFLFYFAVPWMMSLDSRLPLKTRVLGSWVCRFDAGAVDYITIAPDKTYTAVSVSSRDGQSISRGTYVVDEQNKRLMITWDSGNVGFPTVSFAEDHMLLGLSNCTRNTGETPQVAPPFDGEGDVRQPARTPPGPIQMGGWPGYQGR